MKCTCTVAALALLVLAVPAVPALAQHEHHDAKPAEQAAAPPGMDPAMMAGDWTYDITFWMAPGGPPNKSNGTMHAERMMGGRYLHETWTGDMMGMPLEGHGMEGYDNVAKHWYGTGIDNMSTGMMTSTGTCNEAMDSCNFTAEAYDPISGQKTTSRSVISWLSADSFKNEMYGPGPDGKEMKMMEIVAKRKS